MLEGESAASTARDREDRVTMGGSNGGGCSEVGETLAAKAGMGGGDLGLLFVLPVNDCTVGLEWPDKCPTGPDKRFVNVLCDCN